MGGRGVRSGRDFRCGRGDPCSPSVDQDGIVSAAAADLVWHLRPVLSETWNSRRCPRMRTRSNHRWTPRARVSGSNPRIVVVVVCICVIKREIFKLTKCLRANVYDLMPCINNDKRMSQRHTHRISWNTPCGLSLRAYIFVTQFYISRHPRP